jgi:hypothetical protein
MTKPLNRDTWKGPLQVLSEKRQPLDETELAFVNAYVGNGGDPKAAAKAVGAEGRKDLLADPRIREAIEIARDTMIKTAGATRAWSVMQELMESQAVPAQTRFQAARWTLEASGHGLSAVAASIQLGMKKAGKKDLSELSVSELEDFIKRGKETFDSLKTTVAEAKNVIDLPPEK